MTKNTIVKPNTELIIKHFSEYGYWAKFYFEYFPEISFDPEIIDSNHKKGFQINTTEYIAIKEFSKKYDIFDSEIIDKLSLLVLIIQSTVKGLGGYSWANQLNDKKNHLKDLEQIEDLIFKHEQFTSPIIFENKLVKNYDSKVETVVNLINKGRNYKYNFNSAEVNMVILRALKQHYKENAFFINLYKNDKTSPSISDLTKQNKINSLKKDNILLTHQRRLAKATSDTISELKINLTQNEKCIIVGRLFELGELIESENYFLENIYPSSGSYIVGSKSKISSYEKFLQQNIKKFLKEFNQT
ncbi:MAG: hypothetical protein A3F72_14150 [Bacteroidetes bacterium RIFCSPLOWO2_12_FULL_35_15]|nr:MAG: hypothetical protein A3F72_14150 [Bacteroidetes bacterium RIFCSPLOWO2_12_FULL_35_15]